ncbi:MAG: DUF6165 family protein [Chlorobi bacterium]|nr:DUF6165 family protein [Chlorobiota bacterium]MCI0717053.1 DUF6165 family protein [Chlorobiota bacterium]
MKGNKSVLVKIPVSVGELVDKITILEIKKNKITEFEKLKKINFELKLLQKELAKITAKNRSIKKEFIHLSAKLASVNLKLWNIEDKIRKLEAEKKFGKDFIELARSVYINNDRRSEIKNKINRLFGSQITEVKQYSKYKPSRNK